MAQGIFAFFHGPMCVLCAIGTWRESSWRHVVVVVTCCAEIYGRVISIASIDALAKRVLSYTATNWATFGAWNAFWFIIPLVVLGYTIHTMVMESKMLSRNQGEIQGVNQVEMV